MKLTVEQTIKDDQLNCFHWSSLRRFYNLYEDKKITKVEHRFPHLDKIYTK